MTDEHRTHDNDDDDGLDLDALRLAWGHDRELADHLLRIQVLEDRVVKLIARSEQLEAGLLALLEGLGQMILNTAARTAKAAGGHPADLITPLEESEAQWKTLWDTVAEVIRLHALEGPAVDES